MRAVLEEAIEEVRALPPGEQQQLEERAAGLGGLMVAAILYAVFLKEGIPVSASDLIEMLSRLKRVDVNDPRGEVVALLPPSRRAILSGRIRGKYAHIRTSSEAFARLKQEEISLEDQRR